MTRQVQVDFVSSRLDRLLTSSSRAKLKLRRDIWRDRMNTVLERRRDASREEAATGGRSRRFCPW
jgi:hypothetical protein